MQVPSFALSPLLSWLECVLAFTLKFLSQLSMNVLCFKIIFSEQKALASYGTQCIEFAISILGEKGLSSFLCAASPWAPVYKCPSGTWQLVLCLNNFPKVVKNNNCITDILQKNQANVHIVSINFHLFFTNI